MAGNVWNPSAPTLMGLEWFPTVYGARNLRDQGPWAQRVRSRAAETINQLKTICDFASDTRADVLLGEIFTAGTETSPTGSVSIAAYAPSADVTVGAGWAKESGVNTNLFQSIDEGSATPSDTDYIRISNVAAADYICRFGAAGFSATARVLGVKVLMRVMSSTSNGAIANVYIRHTPSSTDYAVVPGVFFATTVATWYTLDLGEINPKTGLPWTPTDIQGFGAAGALWAFKINSAGNGTTEFRVTCLEMQVTYRTVENRVAAASFLKPLGSLTASGAVTLNNFVALPAAGTTWAKPVSGDFTVLFRQPNAILYYGKQQRSPISIRYHGQESLALPPVPGLVSSSLGATYDSATGIVTGSFSGTFSGWIVPLLLMTSAPAVSADSQPFHLVSDATREKFVTSGQTIIQQFTPSASASYAIIDILVSPLVAVLPLVIKIKRDSDNLQFGGTKTLTVAEAQATGTRQVAGSIPEFYRVTVVLPSSAALISGTKYYVEFTCADVSNGWGVLLLGDSTLAGDAASFDATTAVPKLAGVAQNSFDIPVTVAQLPAAPTNLAAAIQATTPANASALACGIPSVRTPRVTWTKTSLAASFLRYEIQRTEDAGVTWTTVVYISSAETVQSWTDVETMRGKPVQYRIRVVRTDGVASDWTAASAGVTPPAVGCEMIFSTNEDPTLLVAYNREPLQKYSMLAASRDELIEIYGADYAVAFMEAEDPGITVGARLTVNFGDDPPVDDVAIFDPLRAITRAATSYVCVTDFAGNRFYAHVQFTEGQWIEPGHEYHADSVITEIAGAPSIAVA